MTSAATTFRVALQLWRHANDRVRVALLRKASCTGEKGGGEVEAHAFMDAARP